MEMKVRDSLTAEGDVDREVGEFPLEVCMTALRTEFNKKGGSDNTVIGRIFSLMTYLVACKLKLTWPPII